jgi:hypothetical protein
MKLFNILIVFLFFIFPLYSQATYSIDDFGTYIITEKGIHRVPVYGEDSQLYFFGFRGQYAVFGGSNAWGKISFFILYDFENDIVSERLSYIYSRSVFFMTIGIKKEKNNVLFRLGNVIYLLDSKTLSEINNYNISYCEFNELINTDESSFFQYYMLNNHSVRYYYGGDYKQFKRDDTFSKYSAIKSIPFNLKNGEIAPFSKNYKYVDIFYSEQLWKKKDFDIDTHIYFCGELSGERAVITVFFNVMEGP